jgi:hypothetical protein
VTLLASSPGGLADSSASLDRIWETLADFQKLASYLAYELSKLAPVAARFGGCPADMCLEGTVEASPIGGRPSLLA